MNFDEFLIAISNIKHSPLSGQVSQFKMVPPFRQELVKKQGENVQNAKTSAVLALFYPDMDHQTKLALILRKTYNGVHSAQVGFPGGKVEDDDANLESTALRETHEEVGVHPEHVEVLRQLTEVYIPPSNFIVHPFLGITQNTPKFILEEAEVEDLIEVYLSDFLDETNIITKSVTASYKVDVEVPAFKLNGHIVWGATAMMLSEIKDLLKATM